MIRAHAPLCLVLLLATAAMPVAAQVAGATLTFPVESPAQHADLQSAMRSPFAPGEARVQQLFGIKSGASRSVTFQEVEFRYDGPSQPAMSTHVVTTIELRVGVTAVGVDQSSSVFSENLDRPLILLESIAMRAFSGHRSAVSLGAWGGPNGELSFRASAPITLTVPVGGSLVLDLRVDGGPGVAAPAMLDLDDEGLPQDVARAGLEIREGIGCPGPLGVRAELDVLGDFAPGGSIRLSGFGYEAFAPVATFLGPTLLPRRVGIPGTPMCWTDMDFSTAYLLDVPIAEADGTIDSTRRPPLPIPRLPQLCGQKIYVQAGSPVTPTAQNVTGVITSNYRTIVVGCSVPSKTRSAVLASWSDRDAMVAEVARPGGFAVRLR